MKISSNEWSLIETLINVLKPFTLFVKLQPYCDGVGDESEVGRTDSGDEDNPPHGPEEKGTFQELGYDEEEAHIFFT
ncbi:hypothetical protein BpHYR1_047701 [Brachionus plicatilis]|uniref:Uncharacterized protein n=1 Tax=Brachionus plicatilis TaxID=10195 RepID=A0A3M7RYB8_BRAPC|nr:hypothetical protein BpHYR1_047701 [Brachionus plicatilis]